MTNLETVTTYEGAHDIHAVVGPLFVIQFLSWSGMFCLWIYAVPVIARLPFASPQAALITVSACFALYALLGASLAFVLPIAIRRFGAGITHGVSLLIGAAGIAGVGIISDPRALWPAFVAIGVAWSSLSNIPYAVVSAAAPPGRGAHFMRVFGFATVVPQIATSLVLALAAAAWFGDAVGRVMIAGGASMALGGLLTLVLRDRFTTPEADW